ncbi:uncharacterized protein LOC134535040 isoform X2 [Bacillus rossius redtenbacheri]|uniref:uncharacterized protein LOC134535040 isoform X2 n=1 Tax=Bacillus rossius redtenbacheri TaxID=93214 RepID=UPI002FDE3070
MLQPRRTRLLSLAAAVLLLLVEARFACAERDETEADRLYSENFNRERRQDAASARLLATANPNEARLHLATKVMSNGVEVIVAGDRSTLPGGDPSSVLRVLTSSLARPITLSDQMVMLLPPSEAQAPPSTSLPCRELVTKTYLTTYTFMTTFLQGGGTTTVSSSTKLVSNVVTEDAGDGLMLPPVRPSSAYTLTGSPSMATGVFRTTYTYLNTVAGDEGGPLVLTSKHTVANTVTAPHQHFPQVTRPGLNTNTYLNTVALNKTTTDEAGDVSITSTNDVVTQVVITESENPQLLATRPMPQGSFTDIVKTYFVTYTYYNTVLQDGSAVVQSDIAISSDVVTEKVFVPQKKTPVYQEMSQEPAREVDVHATKTYLTTFTYYTTLFQDAGNDKVSTVLSSWTKVVQNVVSETIPSSLLPSDYMHSMTNSMREESTDTIVATATLSDGHKMTVTAIERDKNTSPPFTQNDVHSTSIHQPELASSMEESSDNPSNIITGSTIIFFDNFDQESTSEYAQPTPALTDSYVQTTLLQQDGTTMKPLEPLPLTTEVSPEESSSEDIQNPLASTVLPTSGDETYSSPAIITTILATSTVTPNGATLQPGEQVIMMTETNGSITMIPVSDPANKRPSSSPISGDTSGGSEIQVSDLLSLGSLGINGLNALGPVINAMAGLIQGNLNKGDSKRRNDTINIATITSPKPIISEQPHPVYVPESAGNLQGNSGVRSPIYIPVGGLASDYDENLDDISTAESQNYENRLNLNVGNMKWLSQPSDVHERKRPMDVIMGRPTMESPLLSDGIPISPGQVITANSDVIIGKPAIMGPRPPKLNNNNDVPIGMKPPPLPESWPPKLHTKPVIPHVHPPFRPMPEENLRRQPHFPFASDNPSQLENHHYSLPIPDNQNVFNFGPGKPLESSNVQTVFLGKPMKHNHYEHHNNANDIIHGMQEPPIAHAEPAPIRIPSVDRVSGQPMLVNIQPSQVANVHIPHGSSTESVYTLGGDVGSYFDKSPFPVPEPSSEFVGIDDSGQHSVGTVHSDNEKSPQTEPEIKIPAGSVNVDISPGQGLNVGVSPVHVAPSRIITESLKTEFYNPGTIFNPSNYYHPQHHQNLQQNLQIPLVPSGFMVPPPPPSKIKLDHATGRPPMVIPLNEERIEDNSNSHKKKDNPYGNDKLEGEVQVVQESVRRPLRPGQIPVELKLHNSVSTHRPIFFPGTSNLKPGTKFHDSSGQNRPFISYIDKPPAPILQPQPPPGPISNNKHNAVHHRDHPHLPHVYVSTQQPMQRPNNMPHNIAVFGRPQPVEAYVPEDAVDINAQLQNQKPVSPNFNTPIVPSNHHVLQENVEDNTGILYDEEKLQNKLPDLNVHLMPPPINLPNLHHGGRPPSSKFGSNMDDKNTSQNKRPDENIQRPKYPSTSPPPFDLEVQSNTPKPFYERPPLSRPIPIPHRPQTHKESNQNNHDTPFQRPEMSHKRPPLSGPTAVSYRPQTHKESNHNNHDIPSQRPEMSHKRPPLSGPTAVSYKPQTDKESNQNNHDIPSQRPEMSHKRPPLSGPINVPYRPQIHTESNQNNHNIPSQIPDTGNEDTNKRPEPPHKFTIVTKTENPSTDKPTWGRPALHEIPSPPRQTFNPVQLQEETSTIKDSVSTYRPIISHYKPPYINKPILRPSSVQATRQVPSKDTISEITISLASNTAVVDKSTAVKPTKQTDDLVLQTVAIGKPVLQEDISPTTVKKSSSDIISLELDSSFTKERLEPTSTLPSSSSSTTEVISLSTLVTGSETYYGELFTRPATTVTDALPSHRPEEFHNSVPEKDVFDDEDDEKTKPDLGVASSNDETIVFLGDEDPYEDKVPSYTLPTRYVTHTQTLTVTTTETIVVSSLGKAPSTRTLVLTKTQTSTVVDTVTETRTLVRPTSVTATVTTTVSTTLVGTPGTVSKAPAESGPTEPATRRPATERENESFFVVVNDRKPGKEGPLDSAVFLGGVLVPGTSQPADDESSATSCRSDCSASRNELCLESEGRMRCVCRPGFARMFPDQPCKPTYTYNVRLPLERHGRTRLQYDASLGQAGSLKHGRLSEATREGLDRAVMQSDLRDVYRGVAVTGFRPPHHRGAGVLVDFYVQLSENTDEERLTEMFKKSLRTTNYSLGGTDVFADKKLLDLITAEDFNECSSGKFHDCSENAYCFNLRGTYTCSCKEGYADLSENNLFPGRVCSAELIGCENCNYHGSCRWREDDQVACECFQWYTGDTCHINLKVLLIALATLGALLLALLVACVALACLKRCRAASGGAVPPPRRHAPGFLRYHRGADKRAIMQDSSSEGSVDNGPVSFVAPPPPPQPMGLQTMRPLKKPSALKKVVTTVEPPDAGDQRDRSLTVMIPRAKYRPVPPMLTMSTFGAPEKRAIAHEQKLISYLESGGKQELRAKAVMPVMPAVPVKKQSTASNPPPPRKTSHSQLRKQSAAGGAPSKVCGALVSAGFEVSATVSHQAASAAQRTGERTVSEARSCDETTIQAPTKALHSHYGSKNGSNTLNNDEAHTMAERDLGSTLLMPQTHLYKPDRGSDISNFDSL